MIFEFRETDEKAGVVNNVPAWALLGKVTVLDAGTGEKVDFIFRYDTETHELHRWENPAADPPAARIEKRRLRFLLDGNEIDPETGKLVEHAAFAEAIDVLRTIHRWQGITPPLLQRIERLLKTLGMATRG